MPKVLVAVRVKIDLVFDLIEALPHGKMRALASSLVAEDWRAIMERGGEATSQTMGWAAFTAGFQGLLVPSMPDSPHGINLLVFPTSLPKDAELEVLNADLLEKLGKPS